MSETRPQPRPTVEIPYDDIEKIERVVWAEARGEGQEGRNAVRGVILNRLASERFPDTVDEVLDPSQFEPVREYGSPRDIPAPEEDLTQGMNEFVDYVQLGNDAVDGRTFFQNMEVTEARGTSFSGPDPITIGRHTFTRGYEGQEPVLDTRFSHNVRVTYPEQELATTGMYSGGLASIEDMGVNMKPKNMNCGGGLMDMDEMIVGYDEVSGNPVPAGSSEINVRDDIPAALSEGEYVVPADVVRYHGLKTFMALREEAKLGLMAMAYEGQIKMLDEEGYAMEEGTMECPDCGGTGEIDGEPCEHCGGEGYHIAEEQEEGEYETPEGNEVEVAEVETEEEFMEPVEEEEMSEDEDMYPTQSGQYGYKPRVIFATIK